MAGSSASSKSTQSFIPIKEVKDGVAVLDDGSLRAILMTSTINFALKSEDERNAILIQFQNFLNTLDFSLQICSQSRRLDIDPYITLLKDQYEKQENELLKIQTKEYIEFIKNFTEDVSIMTKSFFVIIPYYPRFKAQSSGFSIPFFGGNKNTKEKEEEREVSFNEQKMQLDQRVAVVDQGLSRTGLRTVRLGSEELTELYYSLFNPGEEKVEIDRK